jgi:hypothetical protein
VKRVLLDEVIETDYGGSILFGVKGQGSTVRWTGSLPGK